MDNLQPVAIRELSLGPVLTGDDLAIHFDRDPVRLHAQRFDQPGERKRSIEVTRLAIDLDFHTGLIFAGKNLKRQARGILREELSRSGYSTLRRRNLRVAVRPE